MNWVTSEPQALQPHLVSAFCLLIVGCIGPGSNIHYFIVKRVHLLCKYTKKVSVRECSKCQRQ